MEQLHVHGEQGDPRKSDMEEEFLKGRTVLAPCPMHVEQRVGKPVPGLHDSDLFGARSGSTGCEVQGSDAVCIQHKNQAQINVSNSKKRQPKAGQEE